MKKKLSLLLLSSLLVACGSPELEFKTEKLDYQLPKDVQAFCDKQGSCPVINIELAKIDKTWLESLLNQRITQSEDITSEAYKVSLDEFAREQMIAFNETGFNTSYTLNKTVEFVGVHNKLLAQFKVLEDSYAGGAHGISEENYYLFNLEAQEEVKLSQLFSQTEQVFELVKKQFDSYLIKEQKLENPQERQEYEENWPFFVTENVYFDKKGLVFVYQPYELGSYAQGTIRLTVPYKQLKENLKEEYRK